MSNEIASAMRTLIRGKWRAVDPNGVEIDDDAPTPPPHVLVVDDESFYLVAHEAMFKEHNCKVSVACNGMQALAYFGLADDTQGAGIKTAEEKVTLVCSDYHMQHGMTGFELLMKMKESYKTRDVAFVFVASDVEPPQINECLEAGAVMFIEKPLKEADVENMVKLLNNPSR